MFNLDPNCLSSSSLIIPVFFAKVFQFTLYLDPNWLSMCKVWLQQPHYQCSYCPTVSVSFLAHVQC